MFYYLLAILGLNAAHADTPKIYELHGKCVNSYSKSIDGVFDINCKNMLFQKSNENVKVSVTDQEDGTIIDLSINNSSKQYVLFRKFLNKERIDLSVKNICNVSKDYISCDSYNNQEVILHIEFERNN